jgi:tetratricopeptide (TPR) repeat protein
MPVRESTILMSTGSLTLYNPNEKSRESLIDEFVVRQSVLDGILDDIKGHLAINFSHYLIIGQRGAGKTTLLCRLKYALEDDLTLRDKVIPINLGEEQYQINSLEDLWETIIEVLEDYHGFRKLSEKVARVEVDTAIDDSLFDVLENELITSNKKIILFIENFGDLLRKLDRAEIEYLKTILNRTKCFQVIAGTPISLETVLEERQISFDVFKSIELKGLSSKETKQLLLKLAETHGVLEKIEKIIDTNPQRIEILRRLTGGVIRTMVLLFKIFVETEEERSLKDLQLILDSVTPLYKHRMDDLPAQQQKIVDVVAKKWDAISVKEITLKANIPSKVVSAQLRQLEKNHIIARVPTESKNHLYQLKERFLNIWYLMRYGRRYDKKRVSWLVKFFEAWLTKQELEERIKLHIQNLQTKNYDPQAAAFIAETYSACGVDREIKEKLIQTTSDLYPKVFDPKRINLDEDTLREARHLLEEHKIDEALKKLDSVQNITENNYVSAVTIALQSGDFQRAVKTLKIAEGNGFATDLDLLLIGSLLHSEIRDYDQALAYYYKASEKGNEQAMSSAARLLYRHLDRAEEAESILLKLAEKNPKNGTIFLDLGDIYSYYEVDHDKAVRNFNKAIEVGAPEAEFYLGRFYHNVERTFDKAETHYSREVSNRKFVALGRLYFDLKEDFKTSIAYFEKAIEVKDFTAYYSMGRVHEAQDQIELAIKYYKLAVDSVNSTGAMHRLGHLYCSDKKTYDEAERYFKLAIENGDVKVAACLATFYLNKRKDPQRGIEIIQDAKQKHPDEAFFFEVSAGFMLQLNNTKKAVDDLLVVIKDEEYVQAEIADISSLIIELLARREYQLVLTLFSDQKAQDMLKPLYFALMGLMKEELPNEYLKMGEEMRQIVQEITDKVSNRANELKKTKTTKRNALKTKKK